MMEMQNVRIVFSFMESFLKNFESKLFGTLDCFGLLAVSISNF